MSKILVIDDSKEQRTYAIKSLSAEHDITVADGPISGENLILMEQNHLDIVLTDLSMPGDGAGISEEGKKYIGEPTPYGYPLALFAIMLGVPKVAIVSIDNGHHHPILLASGRLLYSKDRQIIQGKLWSFIGHACPWTKSPDHNIIVKDWVKIIETILGLSPNTSRVIPNGAKRSEVSHG